MTAVEIKSLKSFRAGYSWFHVVLQTTLILNAANIYLFKFNNRNTRKRCEICSKLTIKTPERRQPCFGQSSRPWNIFILLSNNIIIINYIYLEDSSTVCSQVSEIGNIGVKTTKNTRKNLKTPENQVFLQGSSALFDNMLFAWDHW